ncbi:MAG: exodeoxyribonuclease III, partial [Gammaproteobacteria bacterium]
MNKTFKIATWNVNSIKVRLPQVLEWVEAYQPNVLAIQETKTTDADFPVDAIEAAGYKVIFSGQKTYNGMAIIYKGEAEDILTDIPELLDPQRRILIATINQIRVINLYVPNGESLESEKFQYKLDWLKKVTAFISNELKKHERLIVLGDFNIAPQERDVHDPAFWSNHVLFSKQEREAFADLLAVGLVDTFRLFD